MTIRDGRTPNTGAGSGYPFDGGGVSVANSTVRLENVRFENNLANSGGAFFASGSAVTVTGCDFVDNCATGGGGDGGSSPPAAVFDDPEVLAAWKCLLLAQFERDTQILAERRETLA